MRNDKKKNKEPFISIADSKENLYGNIIYKGAMENRTFKEIYRITGFIAVKEGSTETYKMKIDNNYIAINNETNLEFNKYYDLSDENIKAKRIEIETSVSGGINIEIYGLNNENVLNKSQYNMLDTITEFNVNQDSSDNKYTLNFNDNYTVSYIELNYPVNSGNSVTGTDKFIELEYGNTINENDSVKGIKDYNNNYHLNSERIYFDQPLVMNLLMIKNVSNLNTDNQITVYGKKTTESDIAKMKFLTTEDEIVIDNGKCPALGEIKERQRLINDLCNSLTEKDKIRNQQKNYEKTKVYISKLKQQDEEIKNLRFKLDNLIKSNNKSSPSFQENVNNVKSLIEDIKPFDNVIINDLS